MDRAFLCLQTHLDAANHWQSRFNAANPLDRLLICMTGQHSCSVGPQAVLPSMHAGQLVESIGGERQGPDVLVSLFSVFSAAGRLACGAIPERFLHSHGIPRRAPAVKPLSCWPVAAWRACSKQFSCDRHVAWEVR